MTVEDALKEMLVGYGMLDSQAAAVLERMKQDEANGAMWGRWHDDTDECPPQLLSFLRVVARQTGLEYIVEKCPQAWFRPMFEAQ